MSWLHQRWAYWLISLLFLALAGCGFHLQTGASIPPSLQGMRVSGIGPSGGALAQVVHRELQKNGNIASSNGPLLLIDNAYVSQRIISISPSSGAALEFLDTLHAQFYVINQQKKVLLPAQSLLVENSFSYNSGNPLATNEQQIRVERLLMDQGARQILRRVLNSPAVRQPRD
ncbi:hypothetical protein B1757_02085 [Acidithiobacillus marinus]|uniref:LPS-assembly lipoprotein LptE n=1 Tax=Acidithiobacillus marinus TaxID=187490 RepID=A0A2I1DQK4_9PROT|nr:LPS assembly lipoprotein LptE [Acidithiobacillus marinus]PKY12152.1 hypothetical protein B1757_02085 [Acidithiobacillus marinus]